MEHGPLSWHDSVHVAPAGFGSFAQPVPFDWWGSGRLDLLLTCRCGNRDRTRLYPGVDPQAGLGFDFERPIDRPELDGLRFLTPYPNGRETRFDLLGWDARGLCWLPNAGEALEPRFVQRIPLDIATDLGRAAIELVQAVATDWDGDGRIDLLLGVNDLEGYWPDSPNVPVEQQIGFNQKAGHPGYDRSGNWRGRRPCGRVAWLRNMGTADQPRFEQAAWVDVDADRPLDLSVRPAPLLVDWSGREGCEFLASDARGELRLYRNFGGQRPPVLMDARILKSGGAAYHLPADRTTLVSVELEQDRRKSALVYGRADGRSFVILGADREAISDPKMLTCRPGEIWLGGGVVAAAADLDADGDSDLIVGDASGRLWFVEDRGAAGAPRYLAPVELEAGGEPFLLDSGPDGILDGPAEPPLGHACPALVDWTGHGRFDLLLSGAGGDVLHMRNNGAATQPRFDRPHPLRVNDSPVFSPPRVRPAAVDWDRSGDVDLITLDLQGFLCLYPRIGPAEVGDPWPFVDRLGRWIRLDGGFGLSGRCSLWAGAFERADRIDILAGLPRDARTVIPALTGVAVSSLDELPTVLLLEHVGRNILIARPVSLADGSPVVVGEGGCSPCGVPRPDGGCDLLIAADTGSVAYFRREELRW